jgi:hypothetical protein
MLMKITQTTVTVIVTRLLADFLDPGSGSRLEPLAATSMLKCKWSMGLTVTLVS